jgi:hypothetical protein
MSDPSDRERFAALAKLRFLQPADCADVARHMIEILGNPVGAPLDLEQRMAGSVELTIRAMVELGWKVEPPGVSRR